MSDISSLPSIHPRFLAATVGGRDGGHLSRTLSAERWTVLKKKEEWNDKIRDNYDQCTLACRTVEQKANKRAERMYNAIFTELKLSNPPLPQVQRILVLSYCEHLIRNGSTVPFPNENELRAWQAKQLGTRFEKWTNKITSMCGRLFEVLAARDLEITNLQNEMVLFAEKTNVQKDASLRWAMEQQPGKRDKFFTLWNLVRSNKIRELEVLMTSKAFAANYPNGVNEVDVDYGMTALHYSCRHSLLDMTHFLISRGADIVARAPDGRTPLHFAAAYGTHALLMALLSAGAEVDCTDRYHCTPLDLARQNRNSLTIPPLERWHRLVPPPGPYEPDIWPHHTSAAIPYEYREVPPQIYEQMSTKLQLLARRVNGFNPYLVNASVVTTDSMLAHSFSLTHRDKQVVAAQMGVTMQASGDHPSAAAAPGENAGEDAARAEDLCFAELRLLARFHAECMLEGFVEVGMQTLRRRWTVAKRLLQLLLVDDTDEAAEGDGGGEDQGDCSTIATTEAEQLPSPSPALREGVAIDLDAEEVPVGAGVDVRTDDDVAPVSLERLAASFLSTFSSITYLPATPQLQPLTPSEPPAPLDAPSWQDRVLQDPREMSLVKVSETLFIEEPAPQCSETFHQFQYGGQLMNEAAPPASEVAAEAAAGATTVPGSSLDYIQASLQRYVDHEHIRRLQLYQWRFEHEGFLDHYTVFSQTVAHSAASRDAGSSIATTIFTPMSDLAAPAAPRKRVFFLVKLGMELAQSALVRGDFSLSLTVLRECLELYNCPGNERDAQCLHRPSSAVVAASTVIVDRAPPRIRNFNLLARVELLLMKCQLLMFLHDHWAEHGDAVAACVSAESTLLDLQASTASAFADRTGELGAASSDEHNPLDRARDELRHFESIDAEDDGYGASTGVGNGSGAASSISAAASCLHQALLAGQEALDLAYLFSTHMVSEHYSIALALSHISRIRERQQKGHLAMTIMEQALGIAVRSSVRPETVDIALETLRLLVRYGLQSANDTALVTARSLQIYALLDALAAVERPDGAEAAFPVEQRITAERKCTELMALATVMVRELQGEKWAPSCSLVGPSIVASMTGSIERGPAIDHSSIFRRSMSTSRSKKSMSRSIFF